MKLPSNRERETDSDSWSLLQKALENTTFSENIYNIDSFSLNALYCLFFSDNLLKRSFMQKNVTGIISAIIHRVGFTLSQ